MKKVLFTMMAIAAIGFTSCGNKTQQGEATDSTEVAFNIDDEANATIAALTEQLEAGDATKLQQALETVKEKIAEFIKTNPEVAKEYVAKVQTFLKENAEKIKSVVGDNAAAVAAVSALTSVEPDAVVNGLLEQVEGDATDAKDAATEAVNEQVDAAKKAAEDKANEVKENAKQKTGEAIDNAAQDIKKGLGL